MREKGLVHTTTHVDGTVEEWAFTDSAFFFDRSIAKRLLTFYEDELGGNLGCEIDCYGDFLQPLGPKADDSYLGNTTSNIVAGAGGSDSELVTVRKALWSLLQGTTLRVLPLHPSRFYHIGTFVEYLHFIARDPIFAQEVITQNSINVKGKQQQQRRSHEVGVAAATEVEDPPPPTLLNCEIRGDAGVGMIGAGSVVEFSILGERATIGTGCLISGVELAPGCVIPDHTFLQTWAQTVEGSDDVRGYVAHVIATTDDIKKVMSEDEGKPPIAWLGTGISDACDALGIELAAVWPDPSKPKNLWEARIFPTGSSAAEATSRAVSMLTAIRGGGTAGDLAWLREEGALGQLQSLSSSLQLSSAAAQTKLRAVMAHGIEEVWLLQTTL
jgi:fucose-1-phosphate guanylyltransferase